MTDIKRRRSSGESEDRYYIPAVTSLADANYRVLKQGETFAIYERHGDIQPYGMLGGQGLYHEGTRFLSQYELSLHGCNPLLLSSTVTKERELSVVDLTNPDITDGERLLLPHGALHIQRTKLLWEGTARERLAITNYSLEPREFTLSLSLDADFADIFEVRGVHRPRRGTIAAPLATKDGLVVSYQGLDGIERRTVVTCEPPPESESEGTLRFLVRLGPQERREISVAVSCETGPAHRSVSPYEAAFSHITRSLEEQRAHWCQITTSNVLFNDWLAASQADLQMLITRTPHGLYPYAGVPWYSTAFGRDGIITALELMCVNPTVAQGVLTYLAATQAKEKDPARDAEPGKVVHETRQGEMAALGEVPFGRYYGSVDATPLFVTLAGEYLRRTGDLSLIKHLWPNILLALQWLGADGDPDRDGLLEYARRSRDGLTNQGWKDSHDSVFHADGRLALGSIALCEAQAYLYSALVHAADMVEALGDKAGAETHRERARRVQRQFEEAFWCEDIGTYALALDGDKQPCRVVTSNAGHALFAGIAGPEKAARVRDTLFRPGSFSGWGIRTVAETEARYNPMSYHNGSVWPHDNALIAAGMARYGFKDAALRVLTGLFEASLFMDQHRLPELFCGFPRRRGEGPTLYPVACAPQAWAAATPFALLQACLGLSVTADPPRVQLTQPVLPHYLERVYVHGLRVGDASIDLAFRRYEADVSMTVLRREGSLEVISVK